MKKEKEKKKKTMPKEKRKKGHILVPFLILVSIFLTVDSSTLPLSSSSSSSSSSSPSFSSFSSLPEISASMAQSFVPVSPDSDFPIQNLPYGVFSSQDNVSFASLISF